MDIIKWQNIIIEWINCLKLSKPVLIIADLKDGECFKEILTRLSKNEKDILDKQTQISDFLKRHYPAFFLENESSQIQDSIELTYAYSLLLHYCSLVDCSEEFILPLCKDLNYMSQIFVKNFLEDLQLSSVITRDKLKNAIYKMNKYASTPTKSISSTFSSPKTPNNTPLLEYLKTPQRKVNNEETHKKEIKQLQAQLDLERFEKADLQEELNIQYEKNKKLDKSISENQTEIRRLRAKLLSQEDLTPPLNCKQDRNVENKRLSDEIVSLEKYVEILHKEQEELQTERDKARDKLRKMEETTNDWQTKCIQNEKQLLKLTEENKTYLQELFLLRERCDELTTILHELNPKKCHDESYEIDLFSNDGVHNKSGSIVDSASLAQTVIDVQLVDAQTENKRLKTQLIEFQETTEKITIQLNRIEGEMAHLQGINRETSKLLAAKTAETEILNEKITNLECTLNITQNEKDILIDELKVTTEMNKTFIENLNLEIKKLIEKGKEYEANNILLKENLKRFNCDVEKCLDKFKRDLNYDETFPENCDTIYKLTILIEQFEIKNTKNNQMITSLQDSYETLLNQIEKFETEISTLNSNEIERKAEIDQLKFSLKTADNKIEHYEKEVVTNYENLIEKYKSIIEEKCGMISELTKLKDVLINKENTITKLINEQEETEKEKQQLEKNCSNFKNIINEKEIFVKSLELEKTQLQEKYDNLNEKLLTEHEKVKQLKTKLHENKKKMDDLQKENNAKNCDINLLNAEKNDLESLKSKFEILYNQTKQTLNEKTVYINDLNDQKHELENQIDGLNNQIKNLEDDLSQEKTIKDELNHDLKQIKERLQNEKTLKDDLNKQFIISKQKFSSENENLRETIQQKTTEIISQQNEINHLNKKIEETNFEVYNIACMLSTENKNIEIKERTVESLEKHLINLKQQLSQNLEEKQETMDELKNYKQQIEFHKNEFETYKNELENVFDEINAKLNEQQTYADHEEILVVGQPKDEKILGNILEKILKLKENIYNIIYEYKRVTSEIKTLQKQYNILDELKQEIEEKSSNKIIQLNAELETLQEENNQYVSNLETYRENLNKAHETFAETQQSVEGLIKKHKQESENYKETICELKKKNSKQEEQIHELKLIEKTLTDDLFKHQNQLKNVIEDYNTSVRLNEDIKHKKETLTKKLHKQTETFEELQTSLSQRTSELEASLREIEMFKTIKAEFEKSFNALSHEHENTVTNYEIKMKKLKQENDELKEESEELSKEMTKTKEKLNVEKMKQTEFDVRMRNFTIETEKLEEKIVTLKHKLTTTEDQKHDLLLMQEELKIATNNLIQETKHKHETEIIKLQQEINNLNGDLETNAETKTELIETNINLQKTIDDLTDDKNTLSKKVEQLNEDLMRLKSCNDEKYKVKLDEINDTKSKLSYTLNLIENIYILLENELDKTTIELKESNDLPEKLKTSIEQLLSKKKQLEINVENLTKKLKEIEEKATKDKLIYEENNSKLKKQIKDSLDKIQNDNHKIISCLEKRLKKEQNTSKVYLNEVEILNTKLIDKINDVEKISNDKKTLINEYKTIANKVTALKKNRNELIEDHQKIIKEVETYIIKTHESINDVKKDFAKRLEEHKNECDNNETQIKQLENYLQVEKNNVKFLENRVENLTNDKEKLLTFTSKCFTNIHEFYSKIFADNDVTEQIKKLKLNQSEIEDKLQSINYEGEIVDKEIELINNELLELKKIREEMQNYELVKSDYVTLKNKYNLMSVCETENNGYKMKISDLENKLADLQNENVKYQKEITELQKESNNVKSEHSKELHLIKASFATWKKIAEDKNSEIEELIEKHSTEIKEITDCNINLRETIKELEDKIYQNEEVIFKEKCKNEDLHSSNHRLETELDRQTQEREKLLTEGKLDYDIVNQKYELLTKKLPKLEDEILDLQEKIAKYKKIITELEHDNLNLNKNQTELRQQYKILLEQCEQDADKVDKEEMVKLRASYTNLMGENSRMQLDCTVLKKTIDERNTQLSELQFIKESYEKLLEDNNKSHMELDTLRYKRNRDKEEFKRLLEEERAKGTTNADAQITDIRNEYEEKLKKMKEKMVNLYKEEMEREKKRITLKLSQSEEIVQSLKSQLWVTGNKNVDLTKEVERLREQLRLMKEKLQHFNCNEDFRGSRESMSSLKERKAICEVDERRISTLPRDSRSFQRPQVNIIEETVTVSRKRRSINLDQGLKMEDEEGELFNNTYLSDLKAGRCIEPGRESVSSRLSELQYRNSLCPPHLKSSYPAEMQFQSPGQFKEEDLKMGTVDLDDSMSSSLLPGEKPRMKKDWGQTMYKKPGPPTPSKNGGRLSLQGNEVHPRDVLREQNENKPSGRTTSTPSRIKMLFSRSGATGSSSHRNNDTEVGMKSSPRCLQQHHHLYEHSLVPLLTRPEPVRLNPQLIKVYHIPHTFGQAFRIYINKDLFRAFLLMIASAFTTYFIFLICD